MWPIRLASCSSDSTFFTAPFTPYENLEPEEISEAKKNCPTKDDSATKENQLVAPTDHTPGCFAQEPARNLQGVRTSTRGKPVWNRFKQIITRSVAL